MLKTILKRFFSKQIMFDAYVANHEPFSFVKGLLFAVKANKFDREVDSFINKMKTIGIEATPPMLGTVEWPYIHNEWHVTDRLNTIASHYELLATKFPKLSHLNTSESMQITDFGEFSDAVTVVLDYAKWFTREGEIVINIFQKDLRVASMAFTLAYDQQKNIVAYIGAVQGIHGGIPSDESLEIYKVLTKHFAGLRPRSLLLEVLKVLVKKLGAGKLYGVSDQNRHHRHAYFGNDEKTKFKNDYDAFWKEHDGVLDKTIGFYELPMTPAIRDLSEIASKKRGQYRRRNAIVESLDTSISLG